MRRKSGQSPALVANLRVSTAEQGSSRLGLEAQRDAIRKYADQSDLTIAAEIEEVVSAQKEHQEFETALQLCEQFGHTYGVARLDRLSRDFLTIAQIQKSGVDFVAADMPGASKFMVQILAAVAKNERDMIGERTKAVLARAKANGVRMGAPDPLANAAEAVYGRAKAAEEYRSPIRERVQELRGEGLTLQQIADRFNAENFPTPSDRGRWHTVTAMRVLQVPTGLNLSPDYTPPTPANDQVEDLPLFSQAQL